MLIKISQQGGNEHTQTPPAITLKCGRSRHAQQDSSKLSDDPQPSAYASNQEVTTGFFGEDGGQIPGEELRVDTRGVTPNSNPSEREDGKRVGNGVRPMGWRDDQYPSPASAIADVVEPTAS
jgi:hypothetical protein